MRRPIALSALGLFSLYFGCGVVGYHLTHPESTWAAAVVWTIVFIVTPGPNDVPADLSWGWFQAGFGVLTFIALTTALSTVIIPPVLRWWESFHSGAGKMYWWWYPGRPVYMVVNPVDWEKAESVWQELVAVLPSALVVVISETLPPIPGYLRRAGVSFVKGNLRDPDTYRRAGINHAVGACVCAASYTKPERDVIAAGIVQVIEMLRSDVRTVAEIVTVSEVVSRSNEDLFTTDDFACDHLVVFDIITLGAVAACIRSKGSVHMCVMPNTVDSTQVVTPGTVDEAQAEEFARQLAEAGVEHGASHLQQAHVILPMDMDDTGLDFNVLAAYRRAPAGVMVTALYLSVKSEGLFEHVPNAICADRFMAKALVGALLGRDG